MSIRSSASTVVMIVSNTTAYKQWCQVLLQKEIFSENFQELQWRIGVQGNNGVHAITQTSSQRTARFVQHVRMSCMCAVEIGDTRDQ